MNPSKRELAVAAAVGVLFLLPLCGGAGFYTAGNLRNLVVDNLPVLAAAIGMTIVIIAGQIDISTGSQFVVGGVLAGVVAKAGAPMGVVVLAVLAGGAGLGALNGWLVTRTRIPAIVVTLATMVILRNATILATGGDWIQELPPGFQWFGASQARAQPCYVGAALGLLLATAWWLRYTAWGRAVYAVGCNHEAARRVGLNPSRAVQGVFAAMGVFAGAAALLNFTRYPTIESNAGVGFELKVIAAVVVGGTAITGGRGSLLGTLLGVVLLGTIGTVFTFLHVSPAWEKALQGAIILVAVLGDGAWRKQGAHA